VTRRIDTGGGAGGSGRWQAARNAAAAIVFLHVMVTIEELRQVALSLPKVEEGTSYGTLAFRVGKKFLVRLREDNESIALKCGFDLRDVLLTADPVTFFTTDHYRGYPTVLVHLEKIDAGRLRDVLTEAWRRLAPKKRAK
jgi:hypothetical protein